MRKTLTFLLFSLFLATSVNAQSTMRGILFGAPSGTLNLSPGWTFIQEQFTSCASGGAGASTCTTPNYSANPSLNFPLPSTSGSVKELCIMSSSGTSVSITGVTSYLIGGTSAGETWANDVTKTNGSSDSVSCIETVSGAASVAYYTATLSTNCGSTYCYWLLKEALPPSGYTASFDTSASVASASTCTTCTGVGLTAAATDVVLQAYDNTQYAAAAWNSCTSGFTLDYVGDACDNYNVPAGAMSAPSITLAGSTTFFTGIAMAFKTTAGSFTVPTPVFALVNYAQPSYVTATNCSPTCSITIPSTTSGHLLFVFSATEQASTYISSISGFTVPSGCQETMTAASISCAYDLSIGSGTTSLSITMSTNITVAGFTVYEVSRTSGSFAIDGTCAATSNSASHTPSGQSLTIGGTNDVIFQEIFADGGASEVTLYALPYTQSLWGSSVNYAASGGILLNTVNGAAPVYAYPSATAFASLVSGCAFK